ncbi:hypothetical protein [Stenotrophomonas sp.]|uniref:hypothetical protein n=1 Tax=Stenotrophomonas sp. TaxID=69392 RepID=UPI002FCC1919
MDVAACLQTIAETAYFSRMGQPITAGPAICARPSLAEAMRAIDNDGFDWMPSTPGDVDPFHGPLARPAALADLRRQLNQALMRAVPTATCAHLQLPPHDFHLVARDAAMYAYRQWALECHLGLPPHWQAVIGWYERGHWPLARAPGRLLVV